MGRGPQTEQPAGTCSSVEAQTDPLTGTETSPAVLGGLGLAGRCTVLVPQLRRNPHGSGGSSVP